MNACVCWGPSHLQQFHWSIQGDGAYIEHIQVKGTLPPIRTVPHCPLAIIYHKQKCEPPPHVSAYNVPDQPWKKRGFENQDLRPGTKHYLSDSCDTCPKIWTSCLCQFIIHSIEDLVIHSWLCWSGYVVYLLSTQSLKQSISNRPGRSAHTPRT